MLTLVIIIFFFTVIELPAVVMLGIWFAEQAVFAAAGPNDRDRRERWRRLLRPRRRVRVRPADDQAAGDAPSPDQASLAGVLDRLRLLVLTIALLFDAALGALTVRDIHTHGVTPVAVLAIIIVVVFTIGIIGALLHSPRR